MVDPMKELKDTVGELGITLNIKNLHIHMDERMTSNTYYHGTGCCGDNDCGDDPYDEYMDQGDWDEDEEESVGADDCEHCPDCDTCANSEPTGKGAPTIASIHNLKGGVFPLDELVEAVHDKTDVGISTVYRVLNSFFKCMDERSEDVVKPHAMKKGAAYED